MDVGFWGGVIPGNAGNLQEMVRAGVPGSALLTPRVSSKQTKNIFGSNRKEPKLNLFRLCFGLFHETKKELFLFVSVFRTCIETTEINISVSKPTETNQKKFYNRKPTVSVLSVLW